MSKWLWQSHQLQLGAPVTRLAKGRIPISGLSRPPLLRNHVHGCFPNCIYDLGIHWLWLCCGSQLLNFVLLGSEWSSKGEGEDFSWSLLEPPVLPGPSLAEPLLLPSLSTLFAFRFQGHKQFQRFQPHSGVNGLSQGLFPTAANNSLLSSQAFISCLSQCSIAPRPASPAPSPAGEAERGRQSFQAFPKGCSASFPELTKLGRERGERGGRSRAVVRITWQLGRDPGRGCRGIQSSVHSQHQIPAVGEPRDAFPR